MPHKNKISGIYKIGLANKGKKRGPRTEEYKQRLSEIIKEHWKTRRLKKIPCDEVICDRAS